VKVLPSEVMIDAYISTLKQGPERFNPVGVGFSPDLFAHAVSDAFMLVLVKAHIGTVFVCVEYRSWGHIGADKAV
jgi:hypothetical protein